MRMSIGSGIALFVIGAILAFAVNVQLDWIELSTIGYLLMGAGVLIFILGLVLMLRKRQSTTTVRSNIDPNSGESIQQRSTSTPNDTI